MKDRRGRRAAILALVVGATAFGMMLAGGVDLVPPIGAAPEPADAQPVRVVPSMSLPSFADLAEQVSPAVVSIQVAKFESHSPRSNPFEFLFPRRRPQGPEEEEREYRSDSSGSGFVISADGLVVTNHHVIEGGDTVTVTLGDRQYVAEIKGRDPATDLALLKIEPEGDLVYLEIGDSEQLRTGDWVMVIGSPLRLANSVSVGVVSAKGRSINITSDSDLENFIQTDAAINLGNSGGPLVDLSGKVVGIATAINYGAENIGFAVPSSILQRVLPQLQKSGTVHRGYLGINIDDLDHEEAEAFGLDSTDGALVTRVIVGGPSEEAGLRHGDVVLDVNGTRIHNNRELIDQISSLPPGEVVKLGIFRSGKAMDVKVKLAERPEEFGSELGRAEPEDEEGGIEWLGIRYQNLSRSGRGYHNLPEDLRGVWITQVAPSSPLYDKGVVDNDIIVDVNGKPVDSVSDFEAEVEKLDSGSLLRLYILRFDPRSRQTGAFFAVVRVP